MKRMHWYALGVLTAITASVFAAKNTDNLFKLGDGSTDVFWQFDVGDGANNPEIQGESGGVIINNVPLKNSTIESSDIDLGTASDTSRITLGSADDATLSGLTRKAGTLHYSTDQSKVVVDDGANLIPVGSGAGGSGGLNFLQESNFDCETGSPPTNWTASGGTFTAETVAADVLNGDQSCSWDASASAQTVESAAIAVPNKLEGKACLIQFPWTYAAGTVGDYVLKIHDGSDNDLIAAYDLPVATGIKIPVGFTCPTDDTVNVRIESAVADPGEAIWDDVHLGEDFRLSPFNDSAELIASAYYAPTANCDWRRTSNSIGAFSVDADCPSITVESTSVAIDTSDNDLPDLVFSGNLKPGKYQVLVTLSGTNLTAGQDARWAISDGTDTRGHVSQRGSTAGSEMTPITISAQFEYTSSGSKTFSIHGASSSGDVTITANAADRRVYFSVYRYPLTSSADQVTLDTQGWFVDAIISGGNPTMSTSSVSTASEIADAGLSLTKRTNSADAWITCSSGNPSTGTTCSAGNETLGASMVVPNAGVYRACMAITWQIEGTLDDRSLTFFKLFETNADHSSDLQDGGGTPGGFLRIEVASGTIQNAQSHHVCGTFYFASAGRKELVLKYESINAGPVNSTLILADGNASMNERNVHFTMYPLTQNFPQAVALTGFESTSEIQVHTGNGHGSTNTAIRRFSSTSISTGAGITYADSATLGGSFTINERGVYTVTYQDRHNSALFTHGVSLNASVLNATCANIPPEEAIACQRNEDSGGSQKVISVTFRADVGDVVRAHTDGSALLDSNDLIHFRITQVSRY